MGKRRKETYLDESSGRSKVGHPSQTGRIRKGHHERRCKHDSERERGHIYTFDGQGQSTDRGLRTRKNVNGRMTHAAIRWDGAIRTPKTKPKRQKQSKKLGGNGEKKDRNEGEEERMYREKKKKNKGKRTVLILIVCNLVKMINHSLQANESLSRQTPNELSDPIQSLLVVLNAGRLDKFIVRREEDEGFR